MIGQRSWCKHCETMRLVVDESLESAPTGPHTETDFFVRTFSCGHDTSSETESRYFA